MSELFWPTTWWGWGLFVLSIVLVFVPSRYDPAVWIRDRMGQWGRRGRR